MRRPPLTAPWYASAYTGLFSRCGPVSRRPHDPDVCIWAGTLPRWGEEARDLATGGAGWDEASAEAAGVGEAIERWQCRPLPRDRVIIASHADWPLDEPALEPERWVLFHPRQYASEGFPFEPFARRTKTRWVCCRAVESGNPCWVPEELIYLIRPKGERHSLGPTLSTGLSCGRSSDPVLLRGLQEVIERDALMGAWWGNYALEEHELTRVFAAIRPDAAARLQRPNLHYRGYRIASPFSSHVTVVTLEGEDREGYCFSAGSACRETRASSWEKAFLEAVQGRHFVRYLKPRAEEHFLEGIPLDFAGHALYFSLHPERVRTTVLHNPHSLDSSVDTSAIENEILLINRLSNNHPVLFRQVTPPALLAEGLDWLVLRVLVPGLQPMHGHHGYPFLGGPFWAKRDFAEWQTLPPHPFP